MNSKKKNIRKTSGTRNRYKPGQLVTIDIRSAFKTNLKHKG